MSINDSSVNLKLSGASPECTADSYSLEKRAHTGVCQQHPLTLDLEDERGPLMGVSPVRDSVRRLQSIIIISLIKRLCKRRGLIIPKTSTCPRPFHSSELESAPRLVLTAVRWSSANMKPSRFSSSGCEFRSIPQICLSFHIKTGLFFTLWCFCCTGEGEMSLPNGQMRRRLERWHLGTRGYLWWHFHTSAHL